MFMTGEQLQKARRNFGLTQVEAAKKLGVSQSYLSLLEEGKRNLTPRLAKKAVKLFNLPPTSLPLETELKHLRPVSNQNLVKELAALNYPGYTHVRPSRLKNPTQVLLAALSSENLEARLVEALPWLLLNFSDMEWQDLIDAAKVKDLQNRLGFLTCLARKLAEKLRDTKKVAIFKCREKALAGSRLLKEDTFCRRNLTNAEKRWLLQNRTPEAEYWNVLSDLSVEHLNYVK
jgi:transcriptional regulator with XRE-family HTH domain